MKTLEDHNRDIHVIRNMTKDGEHLTGVACSKCGTELHLSNPGRVNMSSPPSRWVFCPNKECIVDMELLY